MTPGYASDAADLTAYGVCLQCAHLIGVGEVASALLAGGIVLFGRPLVAWAASRVAARLPQRVNPPVDGRSEGE